MSLGVLAPVRNRVEQLRIQASQASQVLGVDLVGLLLVGVDEPQLASVGHQDLVAALLQEPANPGRVGSGLYSYAHGPLGGEAPTESLGGGAQPTFFDHLAALGVDEAQVGVPVAQVQSGRRLRSLFANIHGGPILLSIGRKSPYSICRPSKGTAYGGSAFSSHLLRTS